MEILFDISNETVNLIDFVNCIEQNELLNKIYQLYRIKINLNLFDFMVQLNTVMLVKKRKLSFSIFVILFYLSLLIITSVIWSNNTFGKVEMNQLLFTILGPTEGTDKTIITSWLLESLLLSIVIVAIMIIIWLLINKKYLNNEKVNKIVTIIDKYVWSVGIVCLIGSLVFVECNFQVIDYFVNRNQKTEIFNKKEPPKKQEESDGNPNVIYANPKDVEITGDDTNNLIYIYLESYENSFADKENGGVKDVNCLPELTQLAKDNINFSNNDKLGGAVAFTGTTWTIGSMVGQSSGLPLRVDLDNNMGKYDKFMPGAIMIGDILAQKGYTQELLLGSKATFAGTDKLFKQHGNYKIMDYTALKTNGRLQSGDSSQWGISDWALFREAKKELETLANSGQKFNLTMATIDTHTPAGIRCRYCPKTYSDRYETVYACQSKLVYDFVSWCKQQPWYANTTIVIVGDHQTMAVDYVKDIPEDYVRTTYNCIINSKVTTKNIKNRNFTHLDMFPTTLASMGFKVKGNKLGMGTNLFSKLPTATEKYGQAYIEQEIQKSSDFLDKEIYQFN